MTIESIKSTTIDASGQEVEELSFFPNKMELRLELGDLQGYMANISNYSFMATMVIILSFFTMLGVIKHMTENHALA